MSIDSNPASVPDGGDRPVAVRRRYVSMAGRRLPVPASRFVRLGAGLGLVVGGLLGFLPVLGFWMLPLGLVLLSVDLPAVRRWRRRAEVRLGRWRNGSGRGSGP